MGEKTEKIKRTLKNMGAIFGRMGSQTGKILESMEKKDKELDEKMKKALGNNY